MPELTLIRNRPALPNDIAAGIQWLRSSPEPNFGDNQKMTTCWPGYVRDALYIADYGFGAQALALGWHPAELWGMCTVSSLTGRLTGGRIVMLDATGARLADTLPDRRATVRSTFRRSPVLPADADLLWEFGDLFA